ncbi:MAG: nucleotide sugar dehydrogenase [Eubacterium sp.]|nr:nucleotide sugar dehydrogenase [Eubacterium sp.]
MKRTKIAVAGTGYVGLSNAILLSLNNEVTAFDINKEKIDMINNHISPLADEYIIDYLNNKKLNLHGTTDYKEAFNDADFVVISTPTNYDSETNHFDTSSIECVIEELLVLESNATIVIKSTIPVGYTQKLKEKYNLNNILFSPEFLREGKALYDNLYPSRIIVGTDLENDFLKKKAEEFAALLKQGAVKEDITSIIMQYTEAEAVKLFSNTYLAMRVAYFNELDTYAQENHLNTEAIINGMCLDPRIGNHYNNPSLGYGGYCLPKDTKQLLANYKEKNVPNNIIEAIVHSNDTRKNYVVSKIKEYHPDIVGIYRLTMKADSDNFRASAVWDIMDKLIDTGFKLVIYEPIVKEDNYNDIPVINNLEDFKNTSDVILANRFDKILEDVIDKVYTTDIYSRD